MLERDVIHPYCLWFETKKWFNGLIVLRNGLSFGQGHCGSGCVANRADVEEQKHREEAALSMNSRVNLIQIIGVCC